MSLVIIIKHFDADNTEGFLNICTHDQQRRQYTNITVVKLLIDKTQKQSIWLCTVELNDRYTGMQKVFGCQANLQVLHA